MNVRINLSGLKDEAFRASLREKLERVTKTSETEFQHIHAVVDGKLG
jgi:formiminotetrahydrofolate cyclodeaminase